jgi:hypothetical protein
MATPKSYYIEKIKKQFKLCLLVLILFSLLTPLVEGYLANEGNILNTEIMYLLRVNQLFLGVILLFWYVQVAFSFAGLKRNPKGLKKFWIRVVLSFSDDELKELTESPLSWLDYVKGTWLDLTLMLIYFLWSLSLVI